MLTAIDFIYKPDDFKIIEQKYRNGNTKYILNVREYKSKFGIITYDCVPTDNFMRFECYAPGLQCTGIFDSVEDVNKWIAVLLIPYNTQLINESEYEQIQNIEQIRVDAY